jgi:predicted molibdopterin-dependent oxidoreductase YjgC
MATTQSEHRIQSHPVLGPIGDRAEIVIHFDGEPVTAVEGDTVASALLAAGHRVFRTMPKTDDPRGGFCFVGRCADCLMIIDGVPSVRACMTPVAEGMTVRTQRGPGDWNGEAAR